MYQKITKIIRMVIMNYYKQQIQDVFLNFRFEISDTCYKAKATHQEAVALTENYFKDKPNYTIYINKLK